MTFTGKNCPLRDSCTQLVARVWSRQPVWMRLKALQARLFKATIVTKSNIYSKISGHHIRHQTNNPGVGLKYWRVFYVPATDSTKPVIWINFLLDSLDHHLRPAPWEACWYVWNDAPAQPTTLKRLLSSLTELNHIQYYSIHNFPRGGSCNPGTPSKKHWRIILTVPMNKIKLLSTI